MMNMAVTSIVGGDCAAILDRHAIRRSSGVPTVSVLVGPIGAGGGAWRRWAAGAGRSVVVAIGNLFPVGEWVRSVADQIDLPAVAVHCLAQRAGRDPNELLDAWRDKTPAFTFSHRTATAAIAPRIGSCSDGVLSCYDSWPKTSSPS
jgi:hypothetical protein